MFSKYRKHLLSVNVSFFEIRDENCQNQYALLLFFYKNNLYFFKGSNVTLTTVHKAVLRQLLRENCAKTFPVPSSAKFLTKIDLLLSWLFNFYLQ